MTRDEKRSILISRKRKLLIARLLLHTPHLTKFNGYIYVSPYVLELVGVAGPTLVNERVRNFYTNGVVEDTTYFLTDCNFYMICDAIF